MAYLLLAICLGYILLWGLGFIYSLRSKGGRQPIIPLVGLAGFLALGAYSGSASKAALDNPPKLTIESYDSLKKEMTLEDLEGQFGLAQPDERDDFDLGQKGIRIHPRLSDLLGSTRHKDKINGKLQLRVDGKAGPMGANLVRLDGLYDARIESWDQLTSRFERHMASQFTRRAADIRKEAVSKRKAQEAFVAEGKEIEAQAAGDVASRWEALADSFDATAADPSYETMQFTMLKADSEGYIRNQDWPQYGCSRECVDWQPDESAESGEKCAEYEWNCPIRDLQASLLESGHFATVDQGRKTSNAAMRSHFYEQTFNRQLIVAQSGKEAGIGGEYKPIKDTHGSLAGLLGTVVAIPPEPPALGLAGWALDACHQRDLASGAVLETTQKELTRFLDTESEDEDTEEEGEEEAEMVINNGVLGLQVSVVENGEALVLIEGHLCTEERDRYSEVPEWFREQPGAVALWENEEILGFSQCVAIHDAKDEDDRSRFEDPREDCCDALRGEWVEDEDGSAGSCESTQFYMEVLTPFERMIDKSVTAPCSSTLSSVIGDVEKGKATEADLSIALKSMQMDDLYDSADEDIEALEDFGKGLVFDIDDRDNLRLRLGEGDSRDSLVEGTCGALAKWHTRNSKTTWHSAYGKNRPTWAGAMVCEGGDQHAWIQDLKAEASRYLPEGGEEVEGSKTCVWWYTDGMRKQDVVETLSTGVSEQSGDLYTTEIKARKLQLTHAAERNSGLEGNAAFGQITSGANKAAMVTFAPSDQAENFTGGKPSATLKIWEEKGVVMDADFSADDRLVVAGFIDGQLAMWRETGIMDDEQKLTVRAASPSWGEVGSGFEVEIAGNALASVKKVMVGGVVVEHSSADDGLSITAQIPGTLKEGLHNVEVESTGMNRATLINGIRIGGEKPDAKTQASAGCSSRPGHASLGTLGFFGMMLGLIGLRRRS